MRPLSPPASAGLLLFLMLMLSGPAVSCAQTGTGPRFNVRDFGAAGDGKALETVALSRAIRACAQAGGGTVEFPAGEYVTGTLKLLSHVTLRGAIKDIRFSNILADSESGILVFGTEPGAIQDLSFDRIKLRLKGGAASDAVGGNFDLRGVGTGLETAIFKHDIPAMYCQYVDGLQIHGFELEWVDKLPGYFSDGLHCEHFSNLTIDGFVGRQARKSGPGAAIVLNQGSGVSVRNCVAGEGTRTFLSIEHVEAQHLFVNNDLAKAKQAIEPAQMAFKGLGH